MKRLVVFVEGQGDAQAVPALLNSLKLHLSPELQSGFFIDTNAFVIGNVSNVTGKATGKWTRFLKAALKTRKDIGGILVLFDGDSDFFEGIAFCASRAAITLAARGQECGAGTLYSLGVVFIKQEYESLLIACSNQIGQLKAGIEIPENVEEAPRDAKAWLNANIEKGYKSTSMQLSLTRSIRDWSPAEPLRSYRRLKHALEELATAMITQVHIATPQQPMLMTPMSPK